MVFTVTIYHVFETSKSIPSPPCQETQKYCCMSYTAERFIYVFPYFLFCFLASSLRQGGEFNHDGLVDGEAARGRRFPRARSGQGLPHGRLLHLLPTLLRCPGHELVSRLDAWASPFPLSSFGVFVSRVVREGYTYEPSLETLGKRSRCERPAR